MYPRLFQFGHFALPTYGALTALALIAALTAAVYFARRLALDVNLVWNLCVLGILTALIAVRLLLVVAFFGIFRQHPFWVLGLTAAHTPWVYAVAVALGVSAGLLYALAEGLPALRVLDCLAPSVALGLILNRAGAFLAGLDYGLPAGHAWGVVYSSRITAFWYGTPLGVPLYPVQLYEAAASLAVLLVLMWRLPRRAQDGELWGIWLFLSGFAEFFLSFLKAGVDVSWLVVPAAMVIAGGWFLLDRRGKSGLVRV